MTSHEQDRSCSAVSDAKRRTVKMPARTQSCETAAGERLRPSESVRPVTSADHLAVRPWLPRTQGFPRESYAVPMAARLYERRRPEKAPLCKVVSEHLEGWLETRAAAVLFRP